MDAVIQLSGGTPAGVLLRSSSYSTPPPPPFSFWGTYVLRTDIIPTSFIRVFNQCVPSPNTLSGDPSTISYLE